VNSIESKPEAEIVATGKLEAPDESTFNSLTRTLSRYGIVIALALIVLILSISTENFLTSGNLTNILRQVSINGILAVGMTFVILTGGIDLSIGSLLALSGMVAASLVVGAQPHASVVAVGAAIATGAALGAFSGVLIAWVRLPAFVVTLGMLSAVRGLTLIYSQGMPISNLSSSFKSLGQGSFLGIPISVILFAATVLVAWIVLRYTIYGRRLYAVGGNMRSARTCGINVAGIIFSAYLLMGTLSGLAGAILSARTTAALPQAGVAYELDAIAAVVIGGTSLTGGVGGVLLTVVGVLIIGLLNNGLDLMGISSYYQQVIKGLMIVAAVLIDKARHAERA
jgi:putative xylitol transport system permease protein